jgi:dienelactone hydrolase
MRTLFSIIFISILTSSLSAQVRTDTLTYAHGDTSLKAMLIYDRLLKSLRPGIIIFKEDQGFSDQMKERAEKLAEFGYVVLVADLFGELPKDESLEDLKETLSENRSYLRERARLAYELLAAQKRVEPTRVAILGYSFGGMAALELARTGIDLKAVVAFYPTVHEWNPDDLRNIRGAVMLLFGSDDPMISHEEVKSICDQMGTADLDWQMLIYGEAVHGFANPANDFDTEDGIAYNYNADLRSWDIVKLFFQEILR